MERLTKRMNGISYSLCGNVILQKCERCPSDLKMCSCYEEDCGANIKALNKLAAYEDTGKTPEQVAEWAKAEQEGRLVVLPCKAGDIVWARSGCLAYHADDAYTPCEVVVLKKNKKRGVMMSLRPLVEEMLCSRYHVWFPATSIGITVFLTREAAEAALKERESNGR